MPLKNAEAVKNKRKKSKMQRIFIVQGSSGNASICQPPNAILISCVCDHLQKVVACAASPSRNSALVLGDRTEDAELGIQVLADVHDRCNITAAITVVGCRPDRNN